MLEKYFILIWRHFVNRANCIYFLDSIRRNLMAVRNRKEHIIFLDLLLSLILFKNKFMMCFWNRRTSVTEANPNVSGKDSTSSTTSTGSEGSTSGSDGSELEGTLEDSSDEGTKSKRTKELGVMSLKVRFMAGSQPYILLNLFQFYVHTYTALKYYRIININIICTLTDYLNFLWQCRLEP